MSSFNYGGFYVKHGRNCNVSLCSGKLYVCNTAQKLAYYITCFDDVCKHFSEHMAAFVT